MVVARALWKGEGRGGQTSKRSQSSSGLARHSKDFARHAWEPLDDFEQRRGITEDVPKGSLWLPCCED